MSVSLVEVMAAATERLAPLAGESAGHVVLAAADQVVESPRLVKASEVHLEPNGAVRLTGGVASDPVQSEQSLRSLLDALMLVAHSGGAGLMRAGRRPSTGDLPQLIKELEVALIPANRAAARRSLARLHRETERAREAGALEPRAQVRASALGASTAPPPAVPEPSATEPVEPAGKAVSKPTAGSSAAPVEPVEAPAPSAVPPSVVEPGAALAPSSAPADAAAFAAHEEIIELDEGELEIDIEVDAEVPPMEQAAPRTNESSFELTAPLETLVRPRAEVVFESTRESETPAEPVMQRRRSGWPPPYVHAPPDIHETPYLGSLVELLPQRDTLEALPVLDAAPEAAFTEQVVPALEEVASMPRGGAARADAVVESFESDDATTDPMPPAVEWLSSAEVEEVPSLASVLPRPVPATLRRTKPARVKRTSDVGELLARFNVGVSEPEPRLRRGLTQLAGLSRTPPPVAVQSSESNAESRVDAAPPSASEPDADEAIRPSPTLVVSGS